jgi:putative acetyltransferase
MTEARTAYAYRAGCPEDGHDLLGVHVRAVLEVAICDYGEDVARSWVSGLTPEGYAASMADGETFDIALLGPRVVGFCGVKGDEIAGLFVDPDHMRQGIASTLLDRALARQRASGFPRCILSASLTAFRFYESRGFSVIRERAKGTRGGLDMAVVDMERQLAPS